MKTMSETEAKKKARFVKKSADRGSMPAQARDPREKTPAAIP